MPNGHDHHNHPATNPEGEGSDQEAEMAAPTKSALAAVAAGVLVIIAGFLVWNYLQDISAERGEITEIEETAENGNDEERDEEAEERDEETVSEENGEVEEELVPVVEATPEEEELFEMLREGTYQLNRYEHGDIESGEYTIRPGDTLWTIAEAVYGDGFMWTQIADANPGQVYTLPNGHVGINAGTVFTIPAP